MWKKALILILAATTLSCSDVNLFEEFGDKTSDDAKYFEARRLTDKGQYSAAITQYQGMSAAYLAKREVAADYASAYAGNCGLDFLNLISALEGLASSRLFPIFMQAFTGATTAHIESCISAQEIIENISASASSRTLDENLLMTFIQFAKMGRIFSITADLDSNAVVDAAYDACDNTDFPENEVREVGSSLVHIIASLTAVGSESNIADGALTDISTLLNSISEVYDFCDDTPDGSGNCTNTDPSSFDANQIRAIRTFVNENDAIGLGSCNGDFTACLCP